MKNYKSRRQKQITLNGTSMSLKIKNKSRIRQQKIKSKILLKKIVSNFPSLSILFKNIALFFHKF